MADSRWKFCPACSHPNTNGGERGGSPTCWHCDVCGFIECDTLDQNHRQTLHDQIVNIRAEKVGLQPSAFRGAYRDGHRDARHAAAELVLIGAPQEIKP